MKLFFKIVLSVIIIFALIAAGGIFYLTRGLDTGNGLEVGNINPGVLEDGTYKGTYHSGRWANEVSVTVKDHKITVIDVVKDVAFPNPEWREQLFNSVIEKQSTDVDAVSGATVTSKAYLKSIQNALIQGEQK